VYDAHAHSEQRPVALGREFALVHLFAFVHRRTEVLEPILDNFTGRLRARAANGTSTSSDRRRLSVEAAADVGCDHVQPVFGTSSVAAIKRRATCGDCVVSTR